jgi:hypothetical protein
MAVRADPAPRWHSNASTVAMGGRSVRRTTNGVAPDPVTLPVLVRSEVCGARPPCDDRLVAEARARTVDCALAAGRCCTRRPRFRWLVPLCSRRPDRRAHRAGSGVWLDDMRRALLTSGELERMAREDGLSGLTSNPSIFEKAIVGSTDYDAALAAVRGPSAPDPTSLYERRVLRDPRGRTRGRGGRRLRDRAGHVPVPHPRSTR